MRGRTARAAAYCAAALAAAALPACGDDDAGAPPVELGGPSIDVRLELASCEDWKDATVEERLGTIAQIENFVGGPVGNDAGTGNLLDQDTAYDILEGQCEAEYARGFLLYKLYTRAAAFRTS